MVTFYGTGPISFKSQQQPCVAQSTSEAEYVAGSLAVKDLIWLRTFLTELGVESEPVGKLYCDNQIAIKMIRNPEFHQRSKHIDIRFHGIRDAFAKGVFEPAYVSTEENLADLFTNALASARHHSLKEAIGCRPLGEK